jgi:hypothetical protein
LIAVESPTTSNTLYTVLIFLNQGTWVIYLEASSDNKNRIQIKLLHIFFNTEKLNIYSS